MARCHPERERGVWRGGRREERTFCRARTPRPLAAARGDSDQRLFRAQTRWHHDLRLLDLLRRLWKRREQSEQARAARTIRTWMGLRLAARSTDSLQPLLGASRRRAVERAEETRLVGPIERGVERRRRSRFHENEAARLSGRRRERR